MCSLCNFCPSAVVALTVVVSHLWCPLNKIKLPAVGVPHRQRWHLPSGIIGNVRQLKPLKRLAAVLQGIDSWY